MLIKANMSDISVKIKPFKFSIILACMAVFFDMFSMAIWYFPTRYKWDVGKLFDLFFVDQEQNFPTLFSVLLLGLCAVLFFIIAATVKGKPNSFYPHWFGLGIGFTVMACDEFVSMHEKLMKPTNQILGANRSAFLNFSWVVPGMILVAILALVYAWFLYKLPRKTMWMFLLAGALYLGGAIGMELVAGYIFKTYGSMSREFVIECSIEEGLEYTGTILLIYTLLDYLKQRLNSIRIEFAAETLPYIKK
jgi:hypothetical protein